ncbi:hypothetical protein BOX15_Mlig027118g1 [Macrostomum lignano]|uniref:Uncharacterized protein n=2 Tax=Macrostomum lignano TaxID=282301 RepID=A0A267DBG1_9PLAT|nr:hypothetical protein BOX15_Mlig028634g1 [Macrostomum lignano]PAA65863.1 hypothetical protein BOX15_Mlig010183g1 [Macrostomum lignano]PAA80324.1 hypothetical protein BOX15_Mlig027118g1 [Macrostomum lignano]
MDVQVKKSHKVKGVRQKLKLFRSSEPLKSVIMWGINHSLIQLSHVTKRTMLLPDDFKSFQKVKVDNYLFNKDNMPSKFKFKEYCPMVFQELRSKFGIDSLHYADSWTKRQPIRDSSQNMIWSCNLHYVIKTISSEEVEQVHNILQAYHAYIVERSADTLLPQFVGMYRATVEDTEHYLLVMRSVFSADVKIHRKYDLKGSRISREATEKEKAKELPTLKDIDFVGSGERLHVGPEAKARLMATLQSDTEFLANCHLMDYSLLVGIHDPAAGGGCKDARGADAAVAAAVEAATAGAAASEGDGADADEASSGNELELGVGVAVDDASLARERRFAVPAADQSQLLYFIGLIDILTKYGVRKRTAKTYKTMKHGNEAQLSSVKPEVYARRFLEFVDSSLV